MASTPITSRAHSRFVEEVDRRFDGALILRFPVIVYYVELYTTLGNPQFPQNGPYMPAEFSVNLHANSESLPCSTSTRRPQSPLKPQSSGPSNPKPQNPPQTPHLHTQAHYILSNPKPHYPQLTPHLHTQAHYILLRSSFNIGIAMSLRL